MTPCICCDPEGLSKTAEAYRKAASQFNQAKSAFVKTKSGNPGFGLFMAALYPAYMRCKSATQGYLGNIGQMTERISAALKKTSDDGGDTETEIKETLVGAASPAASPAEPVTQAASPAAIPASARHHLLQLQQ